MSVAEFMAVDKKVGANIKLQSSMQQRVQS
jgi:hypothetical protein